MHGAAGQPYFLSWAVTTRLMAEGKSFSGRERNSLFLNTGDERFADISNVSGFDFLDDARAIAATDWDRDGDLDLWVYNRSAPRLRLLRNDFADGREWVAIRLEGTTCNRDGVGARVNVTTADGSQWRTLRCGEGFLSQSTKWLHFGLGDAGGVGITGVSVHWPGGAIEQFAGVEPGRRFVLRQGSGSAEEAPSQAPLQLAAAAQDVPPQDPSARIILAARPPFPDIAIEDGEGSPVAIVGEGPVLLNLWATWCAPCLAELRDLADHADKFAAAGVRIVAVNVDDDGTNPDRISAAGAALDGIGRRFPLGFADVNDLTAIDALQRGLTQNQRDMPVPMSFLIDGLGRLAAAYRGRVEAATVLADAALCERPREEWRAAATPFGGRWLTNPPTANPLRIAMKLFDRGAVEEADRYLARFLALTADDPAYRSRLADVHFAMGRFRRHLGRTADAAASYAEAIRADAGYRKAHVQLAHLLLDRGAYGESGRLLQAALSIDRSDADALTLLAMARLGERRLEETARLSAEALKVDGNHAAAWYNLAFARQQLGSHREAADAYRRTLTLSPGWAMAANHLAWVLATSPDDAVRDGLEAERIIAPLCQGADEPSQLAIFLMTLGAAQAECGRFDEAIAAADRALAALAASPRPPSGSGLEPTIRLQIEGYRQGRPVRSIAR